jgi:hypothetical protein
MASAFTCGKEDNGNTDNNCASCEGKEIIKILIDEPAHVRQCPRDPIVFSFELNNQYEGIFGILPCNEIPLEYRIDGTPVLISGNITNCLQIVCGAPNIKLAPSNLFELTTIKSNKP